jgi:CheY-like chemotaxis protein
LTTITNDGAILLVHALLVEDDVVLRRVISRSLRVRADVDEAGGVAEAIEKLRTTSYDLVIADAKLPDGCAHALLARVREDHPRCRRALVATDRAADPSARTMDPSAGTTDPSAGTTDGGRETVTYERFFLAPHELDGLITWVDSIRTSS